jgi:L-ribulokinase
MKRVVGIGLDFGTGSARAVLIDLASGAALADRAATYPTGIIDGISALEMGLAPRSALQDPGDFLDATGELLGWAGAVAVEQDLEVRTIGISATSCTVLPTRGDGVPMLRLREFQGRPHAYAKLWKHHSASPYAQRISAARPEFLRRYDDRTSPEWSLAKAWQTMAEDPRLWEASARWIDLGDWIVWQLTGMEVRSASYAGCKNHWQPDQGGYPEADGLEAICPGLSSWLDKLAPPRRLGTIAGPLTPDWRRRTGLSLATEVGVAMVDAAAAVPGSDVTRPGILVAAIGTSTCHLSLSARPVRIAGIESTVDGAAIDGLFDYSTGQAATGDMLAWFAGLLAAGGRTTPEEVFDRLVAELGQSRGPSPVFALDWWSGCRTPLGRTDLGGLIGNLGLATRPADIYRAMLEAAAMGMRYAFDLHRRVEDIEEIRITGGIARFPAIMQIYADVLGRPVRASAMTLGSARGAALTAALGAGCGFPGGVSFRDYEPHDHERYAERYNLYLGHVASAVSAASALS